MVKTFKMKKEGRPDSSVLKFYLFVSVTINGLASLTLLFCVKSLKCLINRF